MQLLKYSRDMFDEISQFLVKLLKSTHGEWFTADILHQITTASFYQPNLDLVLTAPTGEIAAFCTFRFDSINKTMALEPMATDTKYRNMGLGEILT